jgi:acetylornithine deacetylase/succinyl-diaminopimelate desuccinylase-like protein
MNVIDASSVADLVDVDAMLRIASGAVRFRSQIPNEGEIASFLADQMRAVGGFDEVILQPVVGDRCNVIGIVRGQSGSGPNILLNGHVDVGRPFGDWTRDPYEPEIRDGWLYGHGLADMKGAVAAQIVAASAVSRSKVVRTGDVVVSAVVHHDVCGLGTKFFLGGWDAPIHAAINGEPTNLKIQVAHGGAWQFEITTFGREAHTSRREEGIDAITSMMKVLTALDDTVLTFDESARFGCLPRLVVGEIQGGTAPSRTAGRCVIRGDIRTVPGMTQELMKSDIERVLDRLREADGEFRAEVRGTVYQRPYRTDETSDIIALVREAHLTTVGHEPELTDALPVSAYVTDTADLARAGIPTVIYGPFDWRPDPDERVRVDDLVTSAKVYAQAALRFVSA